MDEGIEFQGLDELIDLFMEMAGHVRRVVVRGLRNAGRVTITMCRMELADVRYTGELENSFVVDVDEARMRAEIYPTAKHRMFVRMGTRPHWAPIGPLKAWAAAKLGDASLAYPVQRSIATEGTSMFQLRKRGTKANPWPQRVIQRSDFQQMLRHMSNEIGADLVEEIA